MDKKKYINFLFRRIDPDHLKKLVERELSDQEPCYYRKKPDESGFEMFRSAVIDSLSDFVFYGYTKFDESKDYDSEYEFIKKAINMLFSYDISRYYRDTDCSNYGKQGMYESNDTKPDQKTIDRLRRLQELRDSIEYQTEIQDPCNFDDGEEYADFCIGQGLRFFYKDEGYTDDDDDEDYDDYDDDINYSEIEQHPEREEVTNLMYEEFYDYLSKLWEDFNEEGDCD